MVDRISRGTHIICTTMRAHFTRASSSYLADRLSSVPGRGACWRDFEALRIPRAAFRVIMLQGKLSAVVSAATAVAVVVVAGRLRVLRQAMSRVFPPLAVATTMRGR